MNETKQQVETVQPRVNLATDAKFSVFRRGFHFVKASFHVTFRSQQEYSAPVSRLRGENQIANARNYFQVNYSVGQTHFAKLNILGV